MFINLQTTIMSTINSIVVNVTPFISEVSFYDVIKDGEVIESNKK